VLLLRSKIRRGSDGGAIDRIAGLRSDGLAACPQRLLRARSCIDPIAFVAALTTTLQPDAMEAIMIGGEHLCRARNSGRATITIALASLMLLASRDAAATTLLAFDGLDTFARSCQSSFGTFSMGEDVSTQFQHLGVVLSVNEFAIAYAWGDGLPGSTSPSLAVNTIDNATNRCPVGRFGNNGVLTAAFVDPYSGSPTTVANLQVLVADAEFNVHVRTLDVTGGVLHECLNIFVGCPFVYSTAPYTTALLFPGAGVAKVQFIDADATGYADGFVIDNLEYDLQFTVAIDIKPFSSPNTINPKSKGSIPVAILSTLVFDAPARVDDVLALRADGR
jgi:hypothetical protein